MSKDREISNKEDKNYQENKTEEKLEVKTSKKAITYPFSADPIDWIRTGVYTLDKKEISIYFFEKRNRDFEDKYKGEAYFLVTGKEKIKKTFMGKSEYTYTPTLIYCYQGKTKVEKIRWSLYKRKKDFKSAHFPKNFYKEFINSIRKIDQEIDKYYLGSNLITLNKNEFNSYSEKEIEKLIADNEINLKYRYISVIELTSDGAILHLKDNVNKNIEKFQIDEDTTSKIMMIKTNNKEFDLFVKISLLEKISKKNLINWKSENEPLSVKAHKDNVNKILNDITIFLGQGQFNCYTAYVDLKDFSVEKSSSLKGECKILSDQYHGKSNIKVSIQEIAESTINNTILDKDFVIDKLATAFDTVAPKVIDHLILHGHHGPYKAPNTHTLRYVNIKDNYNQALADKDGRVFILKNKEDSIIEDFCIDRDEKNDNRVGSYLLKGNLPSFAKVFVITDIDPYTIYNYQEKTIIAAMKGNENTPIFVCFNESDKNQLIKMIKENHDKNALLLQIKPLEIENFLEVKNYYFDERILKNIAKDYLTTIRNIKSEFNHLTIAYEEIKSKIEVDHEMHEMQQLYQDLLDIESVLNKDLKLSDAVEMMDELNKFNEKLKRYVKSHPYLSKNDSLFHGVLYSFKQIQDSIPATLKKEKKDLMDSFKAHFKITDKLGQLCDKKSIYLKDPVCRFYENQKTKLQDIPLYQLASPLEQRYIDYQFFEEIKSVILTNKLPINVAIRNDEEAEKEFSLAMYKAMSTSTSTFFPITTSEDLENFVITKHNSFEYDRDNFIEQFIKEEEESQKNLGLTQPRV